jgi:hypothetical protein
MFNTHATPHNRPSPLKTLLGVIGIAIGLIFLLQITNIIPFSFDMTNTIYLKIFAGYAIISGIVLVANLQHHGIIRY